MSTPTATPTITTPAILMRRRPDSNLGSNGVMKFKDVGLNPMTSTSERRPYLEGEILPWRKPKTVF